MFVLIITILPLCTSTEGNMSLMNVNGLTYNQCQRMANEYRTLISDNFFTSHYKLNTSCLEIK